MNHKNFDFVTTIKNFYYKVLTFITTGKLNYELVPLKKEMDIDLDTDIVLDFQEING